jgi:hypothetical protein
MENLNQSSRPVQFGKLTVTEVKKSSIGENRFQATLEQEVKLFYGNDPSKTHHEVLLTDASTKSYDSKRIVWMEVNETDTIEELQKKVDAWDRPRIIMIYACAPLLSENQRSAIANGLTTFDKIKMAQLVRLKDREIVPYLRRNFVDQETGEVKARFVAQFKVASLTLGGKTDIDYRETHDIWLDEEIENLLAKDLKLQETAAKTSVSNAVSVPAGNYAEQTTVKA